MNDEQLKGKIFEKIIKHHLKKHGYKIIPDSVMNYYGVKKAQNGLNVKGRGAWHQIDALGQFQFQIPFVYPIRLFSEAKCLSNKVGLPVIRNFVGVLKDISENYFIDKYEELEFKSRFRFTDCGAIFSTTPFTKPAQMYAYAQGVYLIYAPEALEDVEIQADLLKKKGTSALTYDTNRFYYFGVAAGVHPVLITSNTELPLDLFKDTDAIPVKITYLYMNEEWGREMKSFKIKLEKESRPMWEGRFYLPEYTWQRYLNASDFLDKMKNAKPDIVPYIDIPMKIKNIRRIIRLTLDEKWLKSEAES